ncbi:LPXTG cell wall anchor domain-containing protein [Kitasatospora sp. NPDC048239]|uniref:LPXTG cell wall anchor domain-containing protein n=1 Tax=Kitasatospora sp. NPDC048239 TaxID=3364046 RepID=UPI003724B530
MRSYPPSPSPKPSPKPSPSHTGGPLPHTGSTAMPPAGLTALLLLAAGGVLVTLRRGRR